MISPQAPAKYYRSGLFSPFAFAFIRACGAIDNRQGDAVNVQVSTDSRYVEHGGLARSISPCLTNNGRTAGSRPRNNDMGKNQLMAPGIGLFFIVVLKARVVSLPSPSMRGRQ